VLKINLVEIEEKMNFRSASFKLLFFTFVLFFVAIFSNDADEIISDITGDADIITGDTDALDNIDDTSSAVQIPDDPPEVKKFDVIFNNYYDEDISLFYVSTMTKIEFQIIDGEGVKSSTDEERYSFIVTIPPYSSMGMSKPLKLFSILIFSFFLCYLFIYLNE
jgi:hypothetical protein